MSSRSKASLKRFFPVGLMRSPIMRTRSTDTVRVPLHTAAGTWGRERR